MNRDDAALWYWRYKTTGGRVLAIGPAGYESRELAGLGVDAVRLALRELAVPGDVPVSMDPAAMTQAGRVITLDDSPSSPDLPSPSISLFIDPGEATSAEIAELYSALSDLHRAYGGAGLELADAEANAREVAFGR